MELITSLQNQRVKLTNNLQNRAKSRRKERKVALEGVRLIGDALTSGNTPEFALYTPESADYELIAQLQDSGVTLLTVSGEVMKHVSDTQQPSGIIAVFPLPRPKLPENPQRILILDAIREPGNLGTMLRTAAAAAVQVVILAPDSVDPYNPKVLRAGMGAHFRVPIVEANWNEIQNYCEEVTVYLAAGDGDTTYTHVNWTQAWGLIIGNEAHGASDVAAKVAAQRIVVPMAAETESLNAGVAAGVILFEAQRQKFTVST